MSNEEISNLFAKLSVLLRELSAVTFADFKIGYLFAVMEARVLVFVLSWLG